MTAALLRDLAGELTRTPWEAQCTAAILATATADGVDVRCQPMTVGSTRAVRDFRFTVRFADAVPLLLTALGGCVAATAAISLGLRGITPGPGTVDVHSGPHGLAVRLMTPGLAATLDHVQRYSPIYRLLAGSGELRFPSGTTEAGDLAVPTRSVSLTWTEDLHATGPWNVDEPRQLAGSDRAPSPLEYLLAALATETLAGSPGGEVHVSARRDLRGWFGFPDQPPEPRALLVQSVTQDTRLVRGVVSHLVRSPQPIASG